MESSLKKIKLGECVKLVIDNRGKTPYKLGGDWSKSGYRVISALNVHNGFIDNIDQIRCVDFELYKKWMSSDIERDDCFIASEGASLGENTIWDSDEKIVLGQRLYALRTNPEILDPWFLAAYMQSKKFRKQIDQNSTGSTVFGVSQPVLMDTTLLVPTIEKQQKIGHLYKCIKRRIENAQKNELILRNIGISLYTRWFLQFDFPNNDGKPYKSSGGTMVYNEELKKEIPEGWSVVKINDILNEADKSKIQVNGAKEKGKYPFFTSGESVLSYDEFFVDEFNIFLNTGGNPDIKAYKGKCAYSTDTWCINAKRYSYVLYFYLLKLMPQFEQLFFAGSGLKHLQKEVLKNKYILLPSENVIKQFNVVCDSCWSKITNCIIKKQKLTSLRDFLLPLLMNGQVRFK